MSIFQLNQSDSADRTKGMETEVRMEGKQVVKVI